MNHNRKHSIQYQLRPRRTIMANNQQEILQLLRQEQERNEVLQRRLEHTENLLINKSLEYEQNLQRLKNDRAGSIDKPEKTFEDLINVIKDRITQLRNEYKCELEKKERGMIKSFDAKLTEIYNNCLEKKRVYEETHKKANFSTELETLKCSAFTIHSKNKELEEVNKVLKGKIDSILIGL